MFDVDAFNQAVILLSTSWEAWVWVIPGLVIGLVFGALPGISVTMALALSLPLSLHMDFLPAMIFLTSVYTGAGFSGSVPAVLLNIPGTPNSLATTFDGFPMARQGKHNEALGYALFASLIAGVFGYAVLLPLVQPMADAVLQLGSLEMLAIAIWGMLLLGSLGGQKMSRGLMAGAFGVVLGTVGMNTAGYIRGTFGNPNLLDGISQIPAMIGLLAAGQLFDIARQEFMAPGEGARTISIKRIMDGCWGVLRYPGILIRGSMIGLLVGAAPGVGSSVSSLMAYGTAKRISRHPETFGKGNPEGIVAAESAVSSGEGGAMATMLALGIPSTGATAILLAAFGMHNLVPGPSFMDNQKDMVYALILSNMAQAVLLLGVGIIFLYFAVMVIRVRTKYVVPTILALSVIGAIAVDNGSSGPVTLAIFAVIGYILHKFEYPVAAVVVGLLLGGLIETEALRSWQLGAGNPGFLLERPIAMGIFALMISSIVLAAISRRRRSKLARLAQAAETTSG